MKYRSVRRRQQQQPEKKKKIKIKFMACRLNVDDANIELGDMPQAQGNFLHVRGLF